LQGKKILKKDVKKMKKKIIGIVICTLVIVAAVLPVAGIMTVRNNKKEEQLFNSKKIIRNNIEDEMIINEKEDPTAQPGDFKIGYLSVPAAAFVPDAHTTEFDNWGSYLMGHSSIFLAPVYLPHEATVLSLTFYWADFSTTRDGDVTLYRYPYGGTNELMAEAFTSGSAGAGVSQDLTISHAIIDNSAYGYYLWLWLPDIMGAVTFYNAIIEYEYEIKFNSDDFSENQQTQESNDLITR
jgi:hypothetical protein